MGTDLKRRKREGQCLILRLVHDINGVPLGIVAVQRRLRRVACSAGNCNLEIGLIVLPRLSAEEYVL